MNQGSAQPTPKVVATGVTGAAAIILVAVANKLGLDLPPEVAAAIVAVAAFVAGYLKRDKNPKVV